MSSPRCPRLNHRISTLAVILIAVTCAWSSAQQPWNNSSPNTGEFNQSQPFQQPASAPVLAPPQTNNSASPFAQPVQTGRVAQQVDQALTTGMQQVNRLGEKMTQLAETEFNDDPMFATNSDPQNLINADSDSPNADNSDDGNGNSDNGHDVMVGLLENFRLAVFENNRDAQMALVTKYVLPVLTILAVLFMANWIGNLLKDRVSHIVSRRVDMTLGRFAGTVVKSAILAIALMCTLTYYSVEMTSLAALIAALGFAVGMALQGTLGNFASGIALLVFRPFNVGDYIIVDDAEGIVRAIDLFTTSLDTHDNRRIVLPNESVFGNRIENWTHNSTRRVDVLVGVAYSADMKQTREVLTAAMTGVQGALPTPPPHVYLNELNASSVDWSCRVWCNPEQYLAVRERVTEAAKDALDQHNISIPFPQLDLHVVSPALQGNQPATSHRSAA